MPVAFAPPVLAGGGAAGGFSFGCARLSPAFRWGLARAESETRESFTGHPAKVLGCAFALLVQGRLANRMIPLRCRLSPSRRLPEQASAIAFAVATSLPACAMKIPAKVTALPAAKTILS